MASVPASLNLSGKAGLVRLPVAVLPHFVELTSGPKVLKWLHDGDVGTNTS
jgi:hypothetical protein